MNRAKDWLNQARAFLEDAKRSHERGFYYLPCFLSQLRTQKGVVFPDKIRDYCSVLTKYYVGTRYPDAYFSGWPANLFREFESNLALEYSSEVFLFTEEEFA